MKRKEEREDGKGGGKRKERRDEEGEGKGRKEGQEEREGREEVHKKQKAQRLTRPRRRLSRYVRALNDSREGETLQWGSLQVVQVL